MSFSPLRKSSAPDRLHNASRTRAVLNACSAPTALIDSEGTVLFANSALQTKQRFMPGDSVSRLLDNSAHGQDFFRSIKRNRRLKHFGRKLQLAFAEHVISSSRVDGDERSWLIELLPNSSTGGGFAALARRYSHDLTLKKENLRLSNHVEQAQSLANTDPLTGIANRRAFDRQLLVAFDQAQRESSWLSLILLDLDYFKQVNDMQGHPHGDAVLKRVARALLTMCRREGDHCSRYGGEEFAFILPRTNSGGALTIAHQTVAAIQDLRIPHPSSLASAVLTISAGFHSINPGSADPESTLSALQHGADIALYRAKANGKNCAVQFSGRQTTATLHAAASHHSEESRGGTDDDS